MTIQQRLYQSYGYILIGIIIFVAFFISPLFVLAAPPPDFQSTQIIGSGLTKPSGFDFAPDGRIFLLERAGKIKIFKNGVLLPTPFADLPSIAEGDRGLIGIAFDPDFAINHYVYFYYTGLDELNRLVRFDASEDVGTNQFELYKTTFLSEQLHVGGSIAFGADGKLYFAIGDNGYPPNAQDLSNPHGKILRINKDGTIPPDNPFVGQVGKLPEIWAYGLRNPWRFHFDSVSGRLYAADVGKDTWEEINLIKKGLNYGWPYVEGTCLAACPYENPIYAYNHNNMSSAVTGGPVYRGSMFPSTYYGRLFLGDYAQGFIKTLTFDASGELLDSVNDFDLNAGSVVDFKTATDGSLYYIIYQTGRLYRITYSTTNRIPIANATADPVKGIEPLTVNFSSAGSLDPDGQPLTFQWDLGDGTSTSSANPVKTYPNKGTYTVELTVSDGTNSAQAVPIVIQVGIPPTLTIGTPPDGATYRAGDTFNWTAHAIDGSGQDINDAGLSAEVIFHHDTHTHPFLGPIIGRTGSFTTPVSGEADPDTWFEIKVNATDTNNLSTTKSVSVYPIKSFTTLATDPPGLQLRLDGTPIATPLIFEGVVNFQRELYTNGDVQMLNGKTYKFTSWSDNGTQKHFISIPEVNTTYTAYFNEISCSTVTTPTNMQPSGTTVAGTKPITWDAQTGATNGYAIRVDDLSNGWNTDCANPNPGDACSNTVATNSYLFNFVAGKSYNMWVHAINSCGIYSGSNPQVVTATEAPASPTPTPGACSTVVTPTNMQPSGTTTAGTQVITWDAQASATGGYAIRIDDQSNPWNGSCTAPNPGDACSNTVTTNAFSFNFVAGKSYNIWIHAINSCGVYSTVNPQVVSVSATACTAVTTPTNVQPESTTTPGTKSITWDAQTGATNGYAIRIDDQSNPWNGSCSAPNPGDVCSNTVTTNSFTHNFVAGKSYNIWIHAINSCGVYSTANPQVVSVSACSTVTPPANLQPTGTTAAGTKQITWTAQTGANGYAIRIDDRTNGWNGSCASPNPGDVCSNTVTTNSYLFNFVAGKTYNIWVHAINSCGVYSNSTTSLVTVPFLTTANAYVSNTFPTLNFRARTSILVDGSPTQIGYLKFDLTSLTGRTITNTSH